MSEFNCRRCGSTYQTAKPGRDGASVCPACAEQPARTCALAVASVACGIVGCVPPLGLIAVVLGILAWSEIRSAKGWLGGRRLAMAGVITGAVGCALMLAAVIVPVYGRTTMGHRQMQAATHLRGIHQGQIFLAQGNNDWYVGLDRNGKLETDHVFTGVPQSTDWNGYDQSTPRAPAWRMRRLLDNQYFTGEYCISPSETKTVWLPGQPVDPSNFSYALLKIEGDADSPRKREHKWGTKSPLAVVLSDRGVDHGTGYTSVHAVRTPPNTVAWRGCVCWTSGCPRRGCWLWRPR